MHNTTLALVILSLFTTVDKAAEIEGDLLEQAGRHGRLWFWLQIKLTCITLFFHALRMEPGKLLLFGYAVYELVLKLNWWALNPVRRALWRGLDLNRFQLPVMDNAIDTAVAFSLGMLATWLSPRHGSQITFVAAGFMIGRVVLLDSQEYKVPRFIAFALIPAVAGVLLMKWRELRGSGTHKLHASH
jgi:hypothetical protein